MEDYNTWLELALEQHQAGNWDLAEPLYRKVLLCQPRHLDARYLLGTLLLQKGDAAGCVTELEPLAHLKENIPDLHNNLGIAYHHLHREEEALRAFQKAIHLRPSFQQAYFNLAALFEELGELSAAERCYRESCELDPQDAQGLFNLGHVLKLQERWDDAEDTYRRLAEITPHNLDALVNLGYTQVRQERLDEAIETYHRILLLEPGYAEIHNNLSYVFERQGHLQDAIESALKAIELKPEFPEGYNNLGTAYRTSGQHAEAIEAFARAVKLQPDFELAHFNLGTTRLLCGDFQRGWPGYEQRGFHPTTEPPAGIPRWNGRTSLHGKKLWIVCDQGFGDTLQFVRYLPRVRDKFAPGDILLETPVPLASLLQRSLSDVTFVPEGTVPQADFWIPLMSVLSLLELNFENLATPVPYLQADNAKVELWRNLCPEWARDKFKVGLVWQGNPKQARDRLRSCPLQEFFPLLEIEGIAVFSLQREPLGVEQLKALDLPGPIVQMGTRFADFDDAAAALMGLDLLISVDTAIGHLAGGLGCPVWTLLASSADWRWFAGRENSPWYPQTRLFRQPAWGDWKSVVNKVSEELKPLLNR
ncbi:MAG: tetratricopeptide repeat protein [Planctomycetales bacterium]